MVRSVSRVSRTSASSSTIRMRPRAESKSSWTFLLDIHRLRHQRELETEAGSGALPAFHFDMSRMFFHYAIGDSQTEACPFFGTLGGEERIVDAGQVLRRDPLSAIRNLDISRALITARADMEMAAL